MGMLLFYCLLRAFHLRVFSTFLVFILTPSVFTTTGVVIPLPKSYFLLILVKDCRIHTIARHLKARRKTGATTTTYQLNESFELLFLYIDLYSLRYDFGDQGADLCTMSDTKRLKLVFTVTTT